jgi:hypothetical protein
MKQRKPTHRGKLVQITCEGTPQVHAAGSGGSYATLCGLDGADPGVGQVDMRFVSNAQIDCPQCWDIWKTARQYKPGDFLAKNGAL